ncbi:hypothetical protein DFJ73DRAFT_253831 [Zopfochytrium polystomum]|nr:hypothetical protein DFJ73DRAFT_253831 [Zopfochytrium polystomum]
MNVQLKDIKIHAQMHELARQNRPTPPLCANTECGGFESEQNRNDMRLCRACYSPFWSPRHDPGNQKLEGKLAAAYHAQLTVGCGRKHCSNEFCATSTNPSLTTTPLEPTTAAVHTVALLKKSFFYKPKSPSYSICVADEASATRRKAAPHLVGLGFRVEWCVRALAECAGEANAAAWLFANAPRR